MRLASKCSAPPVRLGCRNRLRPVKTACDRGSHQIPHQISCPALGHSAPASFKRVLVVLSQFLCLVDCAKVCAIGGAMFIPIWGLVLIFLAFVVVAYRRNDGELEEMLRELASRVGDLASRAEEVANKLDA